MTHDEAIKIILSRREAKKIYERLMRWNPLETFKQNAFDLKITEPSARVFCNRYGLKFKPKDALSVYRKTYKQRRTSKLKNIRISQWSPKLTIKENAKKLGIGYNYAIAFSNNHKLPYTKVYKSVGRMQVNPKSFLTVARKRILALRKNGFTLEQIGRAFGVTRERIRQLEA